ncbi:hypothetical protein [Pseudohongiella sp.]|uniref:Uncharacterized protein n=1 Tax=marine sediment metagenome TaxID=412755 RepID=A0A0F9YQD8_9ZZZZ|nr:hypothetical protein [Pseudohongiella sp.]HDZ10102.1 hypothetical protein [Pseudohongiella sp.]HEA63451.1 hypothetical protein [Pseudohongiella sp.]
MRQWRTTFADKLPASLRSFDWSELRYVSASGYWPLAVYIVVCVGSVVLVLLVSCVLVLPPHINAWHATRATSAVLADEHRAMLVQIASNAARNLSIASRCPHCPILHERLRPAGPMPVVVDRLQEAAALRGITVSAMRPQQLWRQTSVQAFGIELQVHADNAQLLGFLRDIKNMHVALALTQADWQLASSQAQMTLFLLVDSNSASPIVDDVIAAGNRVRFTGKVDAGGQGSSGSDWQRVAYIQRGNRYLEVQRDARGEMRRRSGELVQDGGHQQINVSLRPGVRR